MPVPSQGNSAGSLYVVKAQIASKRGVQRLRGRAAPRLPLTVCISLTESNINSSAQDGRSTDAISCPRESTPKSTFRPIRPPVGGTLCRTIELRVLRGWCSGLVADLR